MKKWTVWLAGTVLAIAAGAAWYWGSPAYAMSQLRDAALEGDADALEDSIDFPKVRESLKTQLRAEMTRQLAQEGNESPLAGLGAVLAMGMIDPMIEGLINPESMAVMIQEGKLRENDQSAPAKKEQTDWSIERDGLSRFTATPDAPPGEKVPSLVFERDGLGWKMTEIDIPEGGLGAPEPDA